MTTKGEWYQSGIVIYAEKAQDGQGGIICELSETHPEDNLIIHRRLDVGSESWPEAMQNAALIAAAPNLFKAATISLDLVNSMLSGDIDRESMRLARDILEYAIAKATRMT